MPVMSISRCSGPSNPRYGMLTCRVFCRRESVLKLGTTQSNPLTAVIGRAITLAGGHGHPDHGGIKPDRQRSTALERFVIGQPVPGLVGGGEMGLFMPSSYHTGFVQQSPLRVKTRLSARLPCTASVTGHPNSWSRAGIMPNSRNCLSPRGNKAAF